MSEQNAEQIYDEAGASFVGFYDQRIVLVEGKSNTGRNRPQLSQVTNGNLEGFVRCEHVGIRLVKITGLDFIIVLFGAEEMGN